MQIRQERNNLLSDNANRVMNSQYLLEGESPQDAFARACMAFADDDAHGQRLYDAASKTHFTFATPLLSNGGTERGQPISCFVNEVHDSIQGLCDNFVENAALSTSGGGIGTYWSNVRALGEQTSKGVETPGAIPFMHVQDAQVLAYHQGSTRRGAIAAWLEISHPEIVDFINMRRATGGDVHRKNENLNHGVCIPDRFMHAVENDGDWPLIDPNSGRTHEVVKARNLWERLLMMRVEKGQPYIFFEDSANEALPDPLKLAGYRINHSNLCTEIMLATRPDYTAVCCLSSINLAAIDGWWDHRSQLIEDLVRMLDNALQHFIDTAPEGMWRAVKSAANERSIGLGALGFQTMLQRKMIAMEDDEAQRLNERVFAEINTCAVEASLKLGAERGEAPVMEGTGMRHAHLTAVAPNASSSLIAEVSPGIEPYPSNVFTQKTKAGFLEVVNTECWDAIAAEGLGTDEVWKQIVAEEGSVQNVPGLSERAKRVFKTAQEIDQFKLVDLAAGRQPYICQGQSLNLFLRAPDARTLNQLHLHAWRSKLKSLYYVRSESAGSTNTGGQVSATTQESSDDQPACSLGSDCEACEG